MSKGSKICKMRLTGHLLEDVEVALAERNARLPDEIWTFSDWIRSAILEKLDKIRRGRGAKGGVAHPPDYGHETGNPTRRRRRNPPSQR